jgi:type IV pilus assembly protein PilM
MDDRSLWKKELSFGRKPKQEKETDDSAATDDKPTSMWKKELSFKRKQKADAVEGVTADTPGAEEPVTEEPPAAEPRITEKPSFKTEVSFSQRISSYGRSPEAEPAVADETAAPEDPSDSDPGPAAEEKAWKKEVSFSRRPEAAEPVVAEVLAEENVAVEPVAVPEAAPDSDSEPAAEEKAWKKEVSFSRRPEAAEPVVAEVLAEENVAEEPVAVPEAAPDSDSEPAAEEKAWKKEVSFSRKPDPEPVVEEPADASPVAEEDSAVAQASAEELVAVESQVAEEPVVADILASAEVGAERWNAPPSLPPAPVAEALTENVSVPTESVDVHQPAAATDLPSLDGDAPKVPFWKKELSLGRKKRDESAEVPAEIVSVPTESVDVHPPVAAADLPSLDGDGPKLPFWKKELSLGRKKRDQSDEASTEVVLATSSVDVHPPVAAADLPSLDDDAPKVPFWKKELSLGAKKAGKPDKPVKERKEKARKVKAERAPRTKEPEQPKEPKERKQKAPKVKAERGSTKGRIVGLKIGASQLAAARVANNGSAELLQVAREPLASGIVVGGELRDPDALAEALKEFFAKHALPKKGVRLGIANNRIGVRTFEIAGIEDQKQLANAIRFRAQETLPIPIDEAVLDYHVLGEGVDEDGQPTKRVLLVVAYRELVDRYVDACKKAGITLSGIDLEAFALLRALQAPQEGVGTDATAALVVVAIGHERSTFAVSDGRVCEFTRVLEWGGSALNVAIARSVDAAPSEVEATKRALSLMDEMVPDGITADQAKAAREAMRRAIQTFARELVSSLQYYQNQPGSLGIGEIVLTGGTAHLPGLAGELERLIGVHVRVGDPLARMKVSKKVGQPEQIGSLAVAIGLGIED